MFIKPVSHWPEWTVVLCHSKWILSSFTLRTGSCRVTGPSSESVQFVLGHLNQQLWVFLQQRPHVFILQLTSQGAAAALLVSLQHWLQLRVDIIKRLFQYRWHLETLLCNTGRYAELKEVEKEWLKRVKKNDRIRMRKKKKSMTSPYTFLIWGQSWNNGIKKYGKY